MVSCFGSSTCVDFADGFQAEVTAVLGTASAVGGLLEIAIRIVGRLRKAAERLQDLSAVLDKHMIELASLKSMIQTVEDEDDLQTAHVRLELDKIRDIGEALVLCLRGIEKIGKNKSSVRQFAHQLIHGSREEQKLKSLMDDLKRGKFDLFFRIQVASVGVIRIVGDAVFANAQIIQRIDRYLVDLFGEGQGLKIALLLKDGLPEGKPRDRI